MNPIEAKVYLNQLKYGTVFDTVLKAMCDVNLFHLDSSIAQPCRQYVEFSESFFENLVKEVTYHNYLVMLSHMDYNRIISNCLDKSIYLKDRDQYQISIEDLDQLNAKIIDPLTRYLTQLTTQAKNEIKAKSLPPPSSVKIISIGDLEKQFSRLRGHLPIEKIHADKSINRRTHVLPTRCYPATLEMPITKMQLIYPRVPLIDKSGKIIAQKNFLDLEVDT